MAKTKPHHLNPGLNGLVSVRFRDSNQIKSLTKEPLEPVYGWNRTGRTTGFSVCYYSAIPLFVRNVSLISMENSCGNRGTVVGK